MMAVGVSQSSSLARDFSKVQDAAVSIFKIIDRISKIDASSDVGTTLDMVVGNIELQNVSFKYPARTDVQIFRDLCLRIPSGKVYFLCSRSSNLHSLLLIINISFLPLKLSFIFIELFHITVNFSSVELKTTLK
jgi:ATP-binding cassette subfamily B (MDR/TAP) protein 1